MNGRDDRDECLMARLARGDSACLEALVRRHAARLLTFIEHMAGDRHAAEELFQEVFLTVWVKRGQYQFPRPFRPWLYTIAARKCHAALRGRRPAVPFDADALGGPASAAPSPDEKAAATETAALVSAAVTRLPPQQRAVVVLRVWEGMSYAEIAEALGRTEATVRSHMHHALAALRKHLEPRLR
jgi:RNA polymerase sigma-70 factor (ECF subfamily)